MDANELKANLDEMQNTIDKLVSTIGSKWESTVRMVKQFGDCDSMQQLETMSRFIEDLHLFTKNIPWNNENNYNNNVSN